MSFVSDHLTRSLEVEHPVTVILLDEEEEGERDTMLKHENSEQKDNEERTVEVLPIGLDQDGTDWIQVLRGSKDWSVEDADPLLTKVNVVVDTDEERKHDDGDNDDDYNYNDYDTSTTVSELFRSTGSQIFRDASGGEVFLSADDNTSNVGIQGHVTRRKLEVVEHETTRKCIVLAPNTELDSDEGENEVPVATATSVLSAYDVAAALYHSSIKNQGSVLPVVVFKTDSETQTSRNRTTQTGVDQSTMTDEELQHGARKRRRPRQKDADIRETGQRQEEEMGEQRSVAFDNDNDQDQESMQAPETSAPLRPRRGLSTHREYSDDGHSTVAAAMTEKVSVGQQTASHSSTQTPVLVRLDANGSLWMPQDAMLFAGFENIPTGTDRFYYPLGNRASNHHDNQAPPGCRGSERSSTRNFSTQTFGQISRGGIPAETQTSLSGNGCPDDISRRNVEIEEVVLGNDADSTSSKDTRSRRKHDKKCMNTGHDKTKTEQRSERRSKETTAFEEVSSCDESKTDLLKLMLHQIKTLKRQIDEVDEASGKQYELEKEKGGGHRVQHHSPRHHVDADINPDDRKSSSKKTKDSVDRVRNGKKQLDRIKKNYFDASQRDDLESRGNRGIDVEKEWLSADDTHPGRSRLVRRSDDNYRHENARKDRHSSGMERNHRSMILTPSRAHDLSHHSNKYFPGAPQHDVETPRKHDPPRGNHYSNHDNAGSHPGPFLPLGTSSPAPALEPGRRSRSDLVSRCSEARLSGPPAAVGLKRSGSRRKNLEPRGYSYWNQGWRENIDPNSKSHLLLSTIAGSSRRPQRR